MSGSYSRRDLLHVAGAAAGAMLTSRYASAQQPQQEPPKPAPKPGGNRGLSGNPEPFPAVQARSTVSLVHGGRPAQERLRSADGDRRADQAEAEAEEIRHHQGQ